MADQAVVGAHPPFHLDFSDEELADLKPRLFHALLLEKKILDDFSKRVPFGEQT
ncbi:hypothetical protein [Phyllobacterium endophyticum]|uniref:hypothetical protein n=1 Tax=Phyllobacterium endophyticum TaxID=1149773 RepID=UPI001650BA5C|nr:hypothetical protein [Phyllobacterium endophyticum]